MKGVANLHGWALVFNGVVKFSAGHRRAADPVAPGFGPQINHRHADARRGRIKDLVRICEPGGKGVHKAIAIIGRIKAHFAADGRYTESNCHSRRRPPPRQSTKDLVLG